MLELVGLGFLALRVLYLGASAVGADVAESDDRWVGEGKEAVFVERDIVYLVTASNKTIKNVKTGESASVHESIRL